MDLRLFFEILMMSIFIEIVSSSSYVTFKEIKAPKEDPSFSALTTNEDSGASQKNNVFSSYQPSDRKKEADIEFISMSSQEKKRSLRLLEGPNESPKISILNKVLQNISLMAMLFSSFLKPLELSWLVAISIAKQIQYASYVDASISETFAQKVHPFFVLPTFSWEIPQSVEELFHKSTLPAIFEKEHFHSSYFVNQWEFIVSLSLLLGFYFIVFMLSIIFKSPQSEILKCIIRRLRLMRINMLLLVFLTNYEEITLFAVIEFQTLNLESISLICSFIICIILSLGGLFILINLLWGSIATFKIKKDGNNLNDIQKSFFYKKWKTYQSIYNEYKNDSLFQQSYLFFLSLRAIMSCLVIGCLYDYALLQSLWLFCLNLSMTYYIWTEKPIKSKHAFVITSFLEALAILSNFCLISFVIKTTINSSENTFEQIVKISLQCVDIAAKFSSHIFVWIYSGFTVYNTYKKAKSVSATKAITWKNLWVLLSADTELDPENIQIQLEQKTNVKNRSKVKEPLIVITYSTAQSGTKLALNQAKEDATEHSLLKKQNHCRIALISDYKDQEFLSPNSSTLCSSKNSTFQSFSEFAASPTRHMKPLGHRLNVNNLMPGGIFQKKATSIIIEEPSVEENNVISEIEDNSKFSFKEEKETSSYEFSKSPLREKIQQAAKKSKLVFQKESKLAETNSLENNMNITKGTQEVEILSLRTPSFAERCRINILEKGSRSSLGTSDGLDNLIGNKTLCHLFIRKRLLNSRVINNDLSLVKNYSDPISKSDNSISSDMTSTPNSINHHKGQ